VDIFKATEPSFKKHGHAVFYPYHGVLVVAPTLEDAYDLLERIDSTQQQFCTAGYWRNDSYGERGAINTNFDIIVASPNAAIDSTTYSPSEYGSVNRQIMSYILPEAKGSIWREQLSLSRVVC